MVPSSGSGSTQARQNRAELYEYAKPRNRCRGQRHCAGPLNGQLDDVWTVRALRSWLLDVGFIYKRWLVDRDGELGRPCRVYIELALRRDSLRTKDNKSPTS